MKFIEWCGIFEIGVKVIDDQHKKLFEITNNFVDAVSSEKVDRSVAFQTLNSLISYAQEHFAAEEDAAHHAGFPNEKVQHLKGVHEQLIVDIFDLNTKMSEAKEFNSDEIEEFLAEWLIIHVLVEDRKIKKYA